jgi:hypothetical protein
LWAPYLVLYLFLPALLSPYLLAVPAAALAALAALYTWRGAEVARRERLHPVWRSGPLIALLHLLQPVARAKGRLSARRPQASLGTKPSPWSLRSAGRGLFLADGVGETERSAFLEGLRDRLWTARLRPKAPSGWDEADLTSDSTLFWRARMVCYEAWGIFYLSLVYRPRLGPLMISLLGISLTFFWSAAVAVGLLVGLLAVLLLERSTFGRRVHRALTVDSSRRGSRE